MGAITPQSPEVSLHKVANQVMAFSVAASLTTLFWMIAKPDPLSPYTPFQSNLLKLGLPFAIVLHVGIEMMTQRVGQKKFQEMNSIDKINYSENLPFQAVKGAILASSPLLLVVMRFFMPSNSASTEDNIVSISSSFTANFNATAPTLFIIASVIAGMALFVLVARQNKNAINLKGWSETNPFN